MPDKNRFLPPLLAAVGAIVAVAAYLQALHFPFVSDDFMYIVDNRRLVGLRWDELWKLLFVPYNDAQEFLPLRELSYWLDISLFGQNPTGFRLHNIVLYLFCLLLVYAVTASLWRYCPRMLRMAHRGPPPPSRCCLP